MLMPAGLFPTQDTRDVVYAPGSVCVWHIRSGNPTGVTLTIDASSMMPGDMLLVAGSFEPATGLSSADKVVSDAWTLLYALMMGGVCLGFQFIICGDMSELGRH